MRLGVSMGVRGAEGDKKGTATRVGATLATFRRQVPKSPVISGYSDVGCSDSGDAHLSKNLNDSFSN
jgi:hypothetical protein